MAQRDRGRPPLPQSERRGERIELALTAEEREQLQAAAEIDGVAPATWARDALLRALRRRKRNA